MVDCLSHLGIYYEVTEEEEDDDVDVDVDVDAEEVDGDGDEDEEEGTTEPSPIPRLENLEFGIQCKSRLNVKDNIMREGGRSREAGEAN
eukprot:scaffold81254_cov60-Cyclotella_meneghiniana.AAC.1